MRVRNRAKCKTKARVCIEKAADGGKVDENAADRGNADTNGFYVLTVP